MKAWLAAIASVLIVAGCSSRDVPTYAGLENFTPQVDSRLVWVTRVGTGSGEHYSRLRPAFHDDVIYAADRHGLVAALNPENGRRLWTVSLAETDAWIERFPRGETMRLSAGPILVDDTLYFSSENGFVFAVNRENGELRWQSRVPGEVLSAPAVGDGIVAVQLGNGIVVALDQRTGAERWLYEDETGLLSLRGTSTPAIVGGGIVFGTATGKVVVLIADTGQLAWDERIAVPSGSSDLERIVDLDGTPLVVGSTLYVGAQNGEIVAMELMSGEVIWKQDYSVSRSIQNIQNRLVFVDSRSHLVTLDRASGNERWRNGSLFQRSLTEPTSVQGYLVSGDRFGYVHWFNRDTGDIAGRKYLGRFESLQTAPVRVGDRVLVQSGSGRFYMIEQSIRD
ncbi:MAG: outer membrane protein assembly factor BamB [Idiomarina sp.]|nr:outer membrane protein assembly factor BamB [Idiomarina sp.]